ncbi:MAG: geranylgeranylglyceryl/heptaprenylglyceryl phosphate synthase, partial [Candidatus Aenigmatarchaeota archaeon]
MKVGKIEGYINNIIDSGKGVFMPLIDPGEQGPEEALEMAKIMEEGGADLILLGGSTDLKTNIVSDTAKLIKENVKIPIHLFPGGPSNVTTNADSLYFMSLLNSKNPYWITGIQSLGSAVIKKIGLESIPTAYLIFEPGETV